MARYHTKIVYQCTRCTRFITSLGKFVESIYFKIVKYRLHRLHRHNSFLGGFLIDSLV